MESAKVGNEGNPESEIWIVGEAPGSSEVQLGRPFVGASGQELDRMLHEAGFLRSDCYITNVVRVRPPGNDIQHFYLKDTPAHRIPGPELENGIRELFSILNVSRPKVIIALGDTALWALTGQRGIVKWRGSEIDLTLENGHTCTVIPTYHPAAILRMWEWRFAGMCDLRRARRVAAGGSRKPNRNYVIRPTFRQAIDALAHFSGQRRLAVDIETRAGHIACIGFAWSRNDAICIPLMCTEREEGYWSLEEEVEIVNRMRELLSLQNIEFIFQNGLFDLQYLCRYWGIRPSVWLDTMLAHHVCFLGLPKSLDFLSSIYCSHHLYWKDDGKKWDARMGEDQLWTYNCEDCCRTFEISYEVEETARKLRREDQVRFQMRQFPAVLAMMLRGVRCDRALKDRLVIDLMEAANERQTWLNRATDRPFNVRSPKQMQAFFYDELGFREVKNKKSGNRTADDKALKTFEQRSPWIRPITQRIEELRSIGVFSSTFAGMPLDRDGRIRCSYNIAGTETLRYSSSENAFGSGTNLQNVPQGDSQLPNIRKIFIPDSGFEICEADLKGADAQVVAWEANDDKLKELFRRGADVHLENAKDIFGSERLTKDSPERQKAKMGVHATNYGASPRSLAIALGITQHEAERFQRRWFTVHPEIVDWHKRVLDSISTTRSVANKFGFVRHYFSRIEGILPEALAWIPQSTVALVIANGLVRIHEELSHSRIQPLLQTHDSLTIQYPTHMRQPALRAIASMMSVVVEYDDPLIIPIEFKVSDKSWGEVKAVNIL